MTEKYWQYITISKHAPYYSDGNKDDAPETLRYAYNIVAKRSDGEVFQRAIEIDLGLDIEELWKGLVASVGSRGNKRFRKYFDRAFSEYFKRDAFKAFLTAPFFKFIRSQIAAHEMLETFRNCDCTEEGGRCEQHQ